MKQETSLRYLARFIPEGSFELVAPFFEQHTIHLTLTKERKSVLGDYRLPQKAHPYHRISLNINLNPYSFLITLLHELAHLFACLHYPRSAPHGEEWKQEFRKILMPFLGKSFFPKDVEAALLAYLRNPAASTCTDPDLFRALKKYDEQKPGHVLVEELNPGDEFATEDGRVFRMLSVQRTRTRCREVNTGKDYLFQGIVEVKKLDRSK